MDDEVLAGLTTLVGVMLTGENEGLLHPVAVDLDDRVLGVLLDDREQVAEQLPLEVGQVGPLDRPVLLGMDDPIDRRAAYTGRCAVTGGRCLNGGGEAGRGVDGLDELGRFRLGGGGARARRLGGGRAGARRLGGLLAAYAACALSLSRYRLPSSSCRWYARYADERSSSVCALRSTDADRL
jgi:hypothetical protein